ncbi:MAG: efflux RND transporter periplasmic adaptor subunit, partial [Myxococcales bacterium]|nr:efflux RND transporter periplasmic adaptor subunit [Myxococcales bacterium]
MNAGSLLPLITILGLVACQTREDTHAEAPHGHSGEHGQDDEHDEDDEHGEHDAPDHSSNEVHLSPEALNWSGIRLGTASAGRLSDALEVPAEVHLNPDRVAHISPLVDGQLLRVDVTLGDRVVSEQELAEIRSVELGQARAELSRADALR